MDIPGANQQEKAMPMGSMRTSLFLLGLLLGCSSSGSPGSHSGGASGGTGGAGGAALSTVQTGGTAGTNTGGTISQGGSGGAATSSARDSSIVDCVEGTSCPTPGDSCTNSSGLPCTCNGPPGSAILSCNVVGAGGRGSTGGSTGGASNGGNTSASGGATAYTGGRTAGAGGSGAVTTGGQPAGGSTGIGVTCSETSPWGTGNGDVQLLVDAGQKGQAWSRFYEKGVALDHANTLLTTAYGRNAQAALKKGHDQAGFQYIRFHGILNDDIGVYSESNGTAAYDWTRLDQVYDAIAAAGMKPIVEISFTPSAMASTSKVQTALWYNNKSPNISKPKDWTKWEAFMAAIVQHLEARYGAAEVRNNWFFEVWNEPSWMYETGDNGYNELFGHTSKGLAAGDPQIRIGGPAGSAGESPGLISGLIGYAKSNGAKLDFITFHNYANDNNGKIGDANALLSFYDSISNTISSAKFTGTVINDEYGSSYDTVVTRDNEVAASFIAKTVHLVGTASKAGPPLMYAWWALSDLYEEFDTGTATAFREGNYGLLLKGDPAIPASFDVAKPAFNAFRLLHMMGDTRVGSSGGTTSDGVNAVATLSSDSNAVQVLVYNHTTGGTADSSKATQVKLTVNGIPGTGALKIRQYILDRNHANAYQAWVGLGKPTKPSEAQWTTLSNAAELCYFEDTATGTSWTTTYPQNVYGISLFILAR
jgi:xylan 1,4-beta-xylosidase